MTWFASNAGGSSGSSGGVYNVRPITNGIISYPPPCDDSKVFSFNGNLYIADEQSSNTYKVYKLTNSGLELVYQTSMKIFNMASLCIFNNLLMITGGYNNKKTIWWFNGNNIKYDTYIFTSIPVEFYAHSCVVYKNNLYLLGGNGSGGSRKFYRANSYDSTSDASSWTSLDSSPIDVYQDEAVIYNNEIHVINTRGHYKYDGSWSKVGDSPDTGVVSFVGVSNNNKILVVIDNTKLYEYTGTWRLVKTFTIDKSGKNTTCVHNNQLVYSGVRGTIYTINETPYNYAITFIAKSGNIFVCDKSEFYIDSSETNIVEVDNGFKILKDGQVTIGKYRSEAEIPYTSLDWAII